MWSREGALHDPAVTSEPGAVLGLAACDHRFDAALPDEAAVLVVVVAAVAQHHVRAVPGPAALAPHRRHGLQEWDQLGDVVAVAAGERPGKRNAATVYEQVVLAAAPAAVNRARPGLAAPFLACT